MKMNNFKNKKIVKLLYKNLSMLIKRKMFYTRENIINITDINISNDFSNVTVFVSIMKNQYILLKFLNSLSIYFRSHLYKNIYFKKINKINFLITSNSKNIKLD